MNEMEKKVVIEDESFGKMRADANTVLQKLIKNMVEKNTLEGKLQINIDISLVPSYVPIPKDQQTETSGETRRVLSPKIYHKISSTMQIKDDCKGSYDNEMFEVVWDDTVKAYVLKPVTGAAQMSIYDMMNGDGSTNALPAPHDPEDTNDDAIDGEYREVDPDSNDGSEDESSKGPEPDDDSDDSDDDDPDDSQDDENIGWYEYQDPNDEGEED